MKQNFNYPRTISPWTQLIRDIMDLAVADGLTVLRTFAFATDAPYALQTSPGISKTLLN